MRIQKINFHTDLLKCVLWQYDNAENLINLIRRQQAWYDSNQASFWENWYRDVFNLDTANEFGLIIWCIILGLPLFVETRPDAKNKFIFGFDPYYYNFDNGAFTSEQQAGFTLTNEERRIILKLRYYYLTSKGDLTDINKNLNRIFSPLGPVYLIDHLDMSVTYVFEFIPSPNMLNVLKSFRVLPTPQCVGTNFHVTDQSFRVTDDFVGRRTDDVILTYRITDD